MAPLRGVKPEIRHARTCPAHGQPKAVQLDPTECECAPTARFMVAGHWRMPAVLPKGWDQQHYDRLYAKAVRLKDAIDEGETIAAPVRERRVPTLLEWMDICIGRIEALIESGAPDAYSENTLRSYKSIRRLVAKHAISKKRLPKLEIEDVDSFRVDLLRGRVDGRPKSEGYANQIVWTIAGMLNVAVRERRLYENPARVIREDTYGRRSRRASAPVGPSKFRPELARELIARHHGRQLGDIIRLAATTGMRQRELMALQVEDLRLVDSRIDVRWQLVRGQLRRTKYESDRTVPLCAELAQRWAPLDGGSGFVFIDPDTGEPYREQKLHKRLERAWNAVEPKPKRHSWHVFRHTFSTLLDQAGVRANVIDAVMGHRRGGVARTYQHVIERDLDAVLAAVEDAYGNTLARRCLRDVHLATDSA